MASVLSIGEGTAIWGDFNTVQLPENLKTFNTMHSVKILEDSVYYDDFLNNYQNPVYLRKRAVLAATY
jgi:hypothetical protein